MDDSVSRQRRTMTGRRAARSMKAFLGLRDTNVVYRDETAPATQRLFGLERGERNYARVHTPARDALVPTVLLLRARKLGV